MAEKASRYHHGALREALLEATMELVREKGAKNFSAAEAARRVGVSITAPYRHFADRDAMIAALATLASPHSLPPCARYRERSIYRTRQQISLPPT